MSYREIMQSLAGAGMAARLAGTGKRPRTEGAVMCGPHGRIDCQPDISVGSRVSVYGVLIAQS